MSPEGEKVSLGKGLKARGNVEDWLGKVEDAMFSNLRKITKQAIQEYHQKPTKADWIKSFPSQCVLSVSMIYWSAEVTESLENANVLKAVADFEQKCFQVGFLWLNVVPQWPRIVLLFGKSEAIRSQNSTHICDSHNNWNNCHVQL